MIAAALTLPFQPFALRLGQPVIDRGQFPALHQPAGPDLLQGRPGHPLGALHPQGLGGQLQLSVLFSKGIITQLRPVSNDYFPFFDFFQLLPQLLQGDGPVRRQTGQALPIRLKQGVIDLLAPASMAQTMTASRKDARGQAMDSRVEQGAQSLSSAQARPWR